MIVSAASPSRLITFIAEVWNPRASTRIIANDNYFATLADDGGDSSSTQLNQQHHNGMEPNDTAAQRNCSRLAALLHCNLAPRHNLHN